MESIYGLYLTTPCLDEDRAINWSKQNINEYIWVQR